MQKVRLKGESATATVLFARHDVTTSRRYDVRPSHDVTTARQRVARKGCFKEEEARRREKRQRWL